MNSSPNKKNLFVAAILTPEACFQITDLLQKHVPKQQNSYRFEHKKDLHITLGYMHDIEAEDTLAIAEIMSKAEEYECMTSVIETVRVFHSAIAIALAPHKMLQALHDDLEALLLEKFAERYEFDNHPEYKPHISIMRINKNGKPNKDEINTLCQSIHQLFENAIFPIEEVAVMQRIPHYTEHKYNKVKTYRLKN